MLGLSLSPDVALEIAMQSAKVHRLTDSRPLDLARLRDETSELQALIAEATSLERRALGQRGARQGRGRRPCSSPRATMRWKAPADA